MARSDSDDRAGPAVLHRGQGLGQSEPVLELLGPRDALVAEHGLDLVAVLAGPGPAGVLLVGEAETLVDLLAGRDADVDDGLRGPGSYQLLQ
jgi:hypothetical protein